MKKIYGYCRISTKEQSITRQVENILKKFQDAKIYQEIFTGTTTERKEWIKLKKVLRAGDTVVFDSVSRMSRNSEEGTKEYFELLERDINLVFLKEPYINSEVYEEQLRTNESITTTDTDLNETIMQGVREYLKRLATRQIIIAFDQAEKEVLDLRQRTVEGMRVAKAKGNIAGRREGTKVETKKAKETKEKILKYSKDFEGSLKDVELIEFLGIARNSYYKYKRELLEVENN